MPRSEVQCCAAHACCNVRRRGVAAGITRRYMAIWSKEHPNTIPPTAASHAAAKAAAAAGIDLTADGASTTQRRVP